MSFRESILEGIPSRLPAAPVFEDSAGRAPIRKQVLSNAEKRLALKNALRYFPRELHPQLAPEFASELNRYGRIYMYRYRPTYRIHARTIDDYPHRSRQAASIMLML